MQVESLTKLRNSCHKYEEKITENKKKIDTLRSDARVLSNLIKTENNIQRGNPNLIALENKNQRYLLLLTLGKKYQERLNAISQKIFEIYDECWNTDKTPDYSLFNNERQGCISTVNLCTPELQYLKSKIPAAGYVISSEKTFLALFGKQIFFNVHFSKEFQGYIMDGLEVILPLEPLFNTGRVARRLSEFEILMDGKHEIEEKNLIQV